MYKKESHFCKIERKTMETFFLPQVSIVLFYRL
jgi:hypothetical protein